MSPNTYTMVMKTELIEFDHELVTCDIRIRSQQYPHDVVLTFNFSKLQSSRHWDEPTISIHAKGMLRNFAASITEMHSMRRSLDAITAREREFGPFFGQAESPLQVVQACERIGWYEVQFDPVQNRFVELFAWTPEGMDRWTDATGTASAAASGLVEVIASNKNQARNLIGAILERDHPRRYREWNATSQRVLRLVRWRAHQPRAIYRLDDQALAAR